MEEVAIENVALAPAQIAPVGLTAIVAVGVTFGFTVNFNLFEKVSVGDAQESLPLTIHQTESLLAKEVVVQVGLFVPTLNPFFFH